MVAGEGAFSKAASESAVSVAVVIFTGSLPQTTVRVGFPQKEVVRPVGLERTTQKLTCVSVRTYAKGQRTKKHGFPPSLSRFVTDTVSDTYVKNIHVGRAPKRMNAGPTNHWVNRPLLTINSCYSSAE